MRPLPLLPLVSIGGAGARSGPLRAGRLEREIARYGYLDWWGLEVAVGPLKAGPTVTPRPEPGIGTARHTLPKMRPKDGVSARATGRTRSHSSNIFCPALARARPPDLVADDRTTHDSAGLVRRALFLFRGASPNPCRVSPGRVLGPGHYVPRQGAAATYRGGKKTIPPAGSICRGYRNQRGFFKTGSGLNGPLPGV